MNRDELRDKITALRRERDAHQMDESEYVDKVISLFDSQALSLLERLKEVGKEGFIGLSKGLSYEDLAALYADAIGKEIKEYETR